MNMSFQLSNLQYFVNKTNYYANNVDTTEFIMIPTDSSLLLALLSFGELYPLTTSKQPYLSLDNLLLF